MIIDHPEIYSSEPRRGVMIDARKRKTMNHQSCHPIGGLSKLNWGGL
jgi:hypothetical protein